MLTAAVVVVVVVMHSLLDIDVQGCVNVKKQWTAMPPPVFLFILPPSKEALVKVRPLATSEALLSLPFLLRRPAANTAAVISG